MTTTTEDAAMVRGQAIAHLRAVYGLTQAELAERLDVNRMTVSRWETFGAPLTAEYAVRYLLRQD